MLSILLFGNPAISLDGQPVRLPRRKSRALLYYLAAQAQPASREALLGIFWPESGRASAQQTLRTTLYGLRQALGPALSADGELVGLSDDVQVDTRQFETALLGDPLSKPDGIPGVHRALDLYRGDFLAGFSLPGAQPFEDWVTVERERFRRLAVQALTTLGQASSAQGDFQGAINALERALAFDPLQEDLQRELIRLVYLSGDRPGAIRRYDQLRRLLDNEMGVPPMVETRLLYDAIINDRPLPDNPAPFSLPQPRGTSQPRTGNRPAASTPVERRDRLPFTGRQAEMVALREFADSHRLILIEGEPGIGKTRLAEEFIASRQGLVLTGAGRELEQHLPYAPVIEALRGLLRRRDWPARFAHLKGSLPAVWLEETGRLLPELSVLTGATQSLSRPAEESRLWEGLFQFLSGLAGHEPVTLFLDDLQWADASTLGLLGYLVRQSAVAPLTYLAAAQTPAPRSPLAALLSTLVRENRLARLPLNRLSPQDVETITRSLTPEPSSQLVDWLQRSSEGNPYVLDQFVREARLRQLLLPDGQLHLEEQDLSLVPQTIYSLIQSRLAQLPEPARQLLDIAVAAGREFEFTLVAQAAGLSYSDALDALDQLVAARLVHPLEIPHFAFNHSLVMEVAYREVGELRHRAYHCRLAEALESQHAGDIEPVAGLIAWHYAEGEDFEHAWPYAFRAGQAASRLAAWAEAVDFYKQALRGSTGPERIGIWMALGEALSKSGHFASASEVFREALHWAEEKGDRQTADRIRLALARSLLTQARFVEIADLAQQVLAPEGTLESQETLTGPRREAVRTAEMVWGTALSLEGSDLSEAAEHLRAAEALSSAEGDLPSLAQARFELGSVLAQQGDLQGAVDLYRQSLEASSEVEGDQTLEQRILAYNNLAYHLLLLGDPGAREPAEAGLALAQEQGITGLQPYLFSTLGEIALAEGDSDRAEDSFNRGLGIAERLEIPERIAGLTANLGLVAQQRGRTALAIHRLSTALGQADALHTHHLAIQIRLWLAPLLPPAEGRALLAEARRMAEQSGRHRLLEEALRLEKSIAAE